MPTRHVLGGGKWLQGFRRLQSSHSAAGVRMRPCCALRCCQAPPAPGHCWPVVSASPAPAALLFPPQPHVPAVPA